MSNISSPIPQIQSPALLFEAFSAAGQPVLYRKGQIIYLQGQDPQHLYCLLSGSVRTGILSEQGEEKLLTVYRAGSIFGEASFFDGMPRMSSAAAETDCRIVTLSHAAVDHLLAASPELANAMITYLAKTVRMLSIHVDTMSFQSADSRLRNYLLARSAEGRTISITHEELAAALNVSRVTVSRLLGKLCDAGIIRTGYRSIEILSPDLLEEI